MRRRRAARVGSSREPSPAELIYEHGHGRVLTVLVGERGIRGRGGQRRRHASYLSCFRARVLSGRQVLQQQRLFMLPWWAVLVRFGRIGLYRPRTQLVR